VLFCVDGSPKASDCEPSVQLSYVREQLLLPLLDQAGQFNLAVYCPSLGAHMLPDWTVLV